MEFSKAEEHLIYMGYNVLILTKKIWKKFYSI